jgi:hypothetical protein
MAWPDELGFNTDDTSGSYLEQHLELAYYEGLPAVDTTDTTFQGRLDDLGYSSSWMLDCDATSLTLTPFRDYECIAEIVLPQCNEYVWTRVPEPDSPPAQGRR